MNTSKCSIIIHYAWWLPVYLNTVLFVSYLLDTEPDSDKLGYWIEKSFKTIEFVRVE